MAVDERESATTLSPPPSIWVLPEDVLEHLLGILPASSLCSMMQTCRAMHALGSRRCVQARQSFAGTWPCSETEHIYKRAALMGNLEAAVQLGVASQYGEGVAANPTQAGVMLAIVEGCTGAQQPFTWLLFRPPWSSAVCSKANIYGAMMRIADRGVEGVVQGAMIGAQPPSTCMAMREGAVEATAVSASDTTIGDQEIHGDASVEIQKNMNEEEEEDESEANYRAMAMALAGGPLGPIVTLSAVRGASFCVAKTLELHSDVSTREDAKRYYQLAYEAGCSAAALALVEPDATPQQRVALLEPFKGCGHPKVLMSLCEAYIVGIAARRLPLDAFEFVQRVAHTNPVTAAGSGGSRHFVAQPELDSRGKMRYILIDWLVEVADLKFYSRQTLYTAVSIVDRYLQRVPISRRELQLIGISCMVIAGRYHEEEVITIREAAWLTDNTYYYEQVVRMLGCALNATRGQPVVLTHLDFVNLFLRATRASSDTSELTHYFSELVLLHFPTGLYLPAVLAGAVYYLAAWCSGATDLRLIWPRELAEWTGLSLCDLAECIEASHKIIFTTQVTDHRSVQLSAVRNRYERRGGNASQVHSEDKLPNLAELRTVVLLEREQLEMGLYAKQQQETAGYRYSSSSSRSSSSSSNSSDAATFATASDAIQQPGLLCGGGGSSSSGHISPNLNLNSNPLNRRPLMTLDNTSAASSSLDEIGTKAQATHTEVTPTTLQSANAGFFGATSR